MKSAVVTLTEESLQSDGKATGAQGRQSRWRAQQIVARKVEADYHNARLTREIAEIVVVEYEEGIFKQDLATVDGEIKLAESDLSRPRDRLEWARRMLKKGFVPPATVTAEELTLRKARFALEQVQSKKTVLVGYTKGKTIKETPKSEVEKAAIGRAREKEKIPGSGEDRRRSVLGARREAIASGPGPQSK